MPGKGTLPTYETANGLAADLHRHLNEEPVAACPPSQSYRFKKFVSRNKLAFAAGASVLTALIIGLGVAAWQFTEKTLAEERSRTEAIKSKAVVRAINVMLQGVGPSVALGHDTFLLREVLGRVVDMVDTEFKNNPEVDSALRMSLAAAYIDLGEYSNAVHMAEQALTDRRKIFGGDHLLTADVYEVLGSALVQLEDNNRAEIYHRKALGIREKKLGQKNAEYAKSLANVGVTLGKQRNLPASKAALNKALGIFGELSLEKTAECAQTHRTLGSVLYLEGDLPGAEEHEQMALDIDYYCVGTNHPRIVSGLVNLATTLATQGKLPQAEDYLFRALNLATNLFQSPRGEVASILDNLGAVLTQEGKLLQARAAIEQALDLAKVLARGQDDPRTAGIMVNLATTEQAMGDLTNAEKRLREARAIFEKHPELEYELETAQDNLADVPR